MRRRNAAVFTVILLTISSIFSGCGSKAIPEGYAPVQSEEIADLLSETDEQPKQPEAHTSIDLYYFGAPSGHLENTLTTLCANVTRNTDWKVAINNCKSGDYISDIEMLSDLCNGKIDMAVVSTASCASFSPSIGISAMPFVFDDLEEARKFMLSEEEKTAERDLSEYGIKVIGHFDNGFKCFSSYFPMGSIQSIYSFKDKSIATTNSQIGLETIEAFGGIPYVINIDKMKERLSYQILMGCEMSIAELYEYKIYEVQKNVALTNHIYDGLILLVREEVWNSLDDNLRKRISVSIKEAEEADRLSVKKETETAFRRFVLDKMIITEPEREGMKKAAKAIPEAFSDIYPEEYVELIGQMIDDTDVSIEKNRENMPKTIKILLDK